jgi:DNA-binding PadR family transcriptional regulator
MSTRLVILGLLQDQPLYGYEIKQLIEEHMNDWTSIAFGSIYFALDKLSEEGLIEKVATEQPGNRPSRSVYQITENGRQEFFLLLRGTWSEIERSYFSLDIGLFFMSALPMEEIKGYLKKRIDKLAEMLKYLEGHENEQMQDEHVPPVARAIFSHSLAHLKAELSWTQDVIRKVESGEFV